MFLDGFVGARSVSPRKSSTLRLPANVLLCNSLADASIALDELKKMSSRLGQISERSSGVQASAMAATSLSGFVLHSVCKLINALSEMTQHLRMASDLPGYFEVPIDLLLDIESEVSVFERQRPSLSEIYESTSLAGGPLLLERK